jgi:23S rRNA pseudouridine1911/1915/1917 synthase
LADHGHPLLGDPDYGRSPRDPALRQTGRRLDRQALHAYLLAFTHPETGQRLRFVSPLPDDMQRALGELRREPK